MKKSSAKNVDEYLAMLPPATKTTLEKVRKTIKAAAPKAEEVISYQVPCYKYNGPLVFFAAFPHHCSFFTVNKSIIETFKKELLPHKTSGTTIHFTPEKPLAATLIQKIVKLRIKQNEGRGLVKKKAAPAVKKIQTGKSPDAEKVKEYLQKLQPEVKKEIEAVRKIIKNGAPKLNERIKWNAPSYYYKEDIVTFGPYKTHKLLLVFHHPFVVKIKSPLLEGNYKDRRLVYFKNKAEAEKNKKELSRIINEIIKLVDKK